MSEDLPLRMLRRVAWTNAAQVAGRAMLEFQHDADVAVVIDRHSRRRSVCGCHNRKGLRVFKSNVLTGPAFPGRDRVR